MRKLIPIVLLVVAACGDDGGKTENPKIDAPAGVDSQPVDASVDAPPGPPHLVIKNYLDWCTLSVAGGAFSPGDHDDPVTAGTVTVAAKRKNASFEISGNVWHLTTGDTGTGEPGTITNPNDPATKTSTTTATVAAAGATCIWACCPFAGGGGCDGIANQCP